MQLEEMFKKLDVSERSFTLSGWEAINYLDYVARTKVEQILCGEEDASGATEMLEDIIEMKHEIEKHDYECVKFVECEMSASHICILPMIEEQELKEAIEDLAEWVINNYCTSTPPPPPPLIFGQRKHQDMLDKFVEERRQQ